MFSGNLELYVIFFKKKQDNRKNVRLVTCKKIHSKECRPDSLIAQQE